MILLKLKKYSSLLFIIINIGAFINEANANFYDGIKAFEEKKFEFAEKAFCEQLNNGSAFSFSYLKYIEKNSNSKIQCLSKINSSLFPQDNLKLSQSYLESSLIQMNVLQHGLNESLVRSMYTLVTQGNAHALFLIGQWLENNQIPIELLQKLLPQKLSKNIFDIKSLYSVSLKKFKFHQIILNPQILLKINELFLGDEVFTKSLFQSCPELSLFKDEIKNFSKLYSTGLNSIGAIAYEIAQSSKNVHNVLAWYTLSVESGLDDNQSRKVAIEYIVNHTWADQPSFSRYYAKFYEVNSEVQIQDHQLLFYYAMILSTGMGGKVDLENSYKYLKKIKNQKLHDSNWNFLNDLLNDNRFKKNFAYVFKQAIEKNKNNFIFSFFYDSLIRYSLFYFTHNQEESLKLVRELHIYYSKNDDINSLIQAAYSFDKGIGGPVDYEKARQYYKKAAELGSEIALKEYINLALDKKGGNCSCDDLYEKILKLADKGEPYYQFMVASFHYTNLVGPFDVKLANSYLLKAADQGYAQAQFNYAAVLISEIDANEEINLQEVDHEVLRKKYKFFYYLDSSAKNGHLVAKKLLKRLLQVNEGFFIDNSDKMNFNSFGLIKVSDKLKEAEALKNNIENTSHDSKEEINQKSTSTDPISENKQIETVDIMAEINEQMSLWNKQCEDFKTKKNSAQHFLSNIKYIVQNIEPIVENEIVEIDVEQFDDKVKEFVNVVFGVGSKKFIHYTNRELKKILVDLGCTVTDDHGENTTHVLFRKKNGDELKMSYHNPHGHGDNDRLYNKIKKPVKKFFTSLGL